MKISYIGLCTLLSNFFPSLTRICPPLNSYGYLQSMMLYSPKWILRQQLTHDFRADTLQVLLFASNSRQATCLVENVITTLVMGLFTKLGNICGILSLIPCHLKLLFILFSTRSFYLWCNKKHLSDTDPCISKIILKNQHLDVTGHRVLVTSTTSHFEM